MKKYDLHMHTSFSPDSRSKPKDILEKARSVGLNGIAITDHQTIDGALLTRDLNDDKDFEVIIGEEVTTNQGDVLGLYLEREIRQRDLFKLIDDVKSQGGIVIIPHPFRPTQRFGYPLEKLVGKIDAVETINSRNPTSSNKAAEEAAIRLPLAAVGSSDAHILSDIGNAYTLFDGELRQAMIERKTVAGGSNKFFTAFLSHLAAGWNKGTDRVLRPRA